MRISDWSSDVCSSDLIGARQQFGHAVAVEDVIAKHERGWFAVHKVSADRIGLGKPARLRLNGVMQRHAPLAAVAKQALEAGLVLRGGDDQNLANPRQHQDGKRIIRSEEHTSELQSLMRISYAVF